jgi:HlyD family secretion protein
MTRPSANNRALANRPEPQQPSDGLQTLGVQSLEDTGFASEDLRLESRPPSWMPMVIGSSLSVLVLFLIAAAALIKVDRVVPVAGRLQTLRSTQEVSAPEQGVISQVLVKENQLVSAGQPLVVLDTETLKAEASSMVDKQRSLVATSLAEVQRLRAAIAEARARLVGTQQQLRITDAQLAQLRPLAQEGGYGQLSVLDSEKSRAELNARIRSTQAEIQKLQAESAQKEALVASDLSASRASLVATRNRLRQIVLKAPFKGTILDLSAKRGQVAISAGPLLKVVPIDNLLARVDMPDADLAFVRPGQSAELEFPAYRRDKYGWLPAEVISIGTDALPPDETSELKVPRFPVKLKLARQYLEVDGQRFGLQAGMALTANLKLDKASILELLFNQFTGGARALRTIR